MRYPNAGLTDKGETTVLASVMVGLEDFITHQGGHGESVLKRVGLSSDMPLNPNAPISLRNYCAAMDEAVRQTGNDNFGLWFGNQFKTEALGMLGFLLLSSTTLREAINNLVTFFPVHQKNTLLTFNENKGLGMINYHVADGNLLSRRHDAELSIALFVNIFRGVLGSGWHPLEIHFEHAKPTNTRDHRRFLGCDVFFLKPTNAIVFRSAQLDTVMPTNNQLLYNVLRQSIQELTSVPTSGLSVVGKVKDELVMCFADGNPKLEEVANRLNIPSWTLQRRLADEGSTFKEVVEHTRKELANFHLQNNIANITELATLLGYTEISAFSRAFQRWYGIAPSKWRKEFK